MHKLHRPKTLQITVNWSNQCLHTAASMTKASCITYHVCKQIQHY